MTTDFGWRNFMVDSTEAALTEILRKLNQEVIPGISKVREDIAVIQEGNKSRASNMIRHSLAIEELEDIIKGNGSRKGLSTRIELVENWIGSQVWMQRIIVGAVVSEIVGLVILLFIR